MSQTRKYYDVGKLLSYNAEINGVFGSRSIGKTYGLMKQCVLDWMNRREEFGYIRRYQSELEVVQDNILDDVMQEFPDYETKRTKDRYYIRKRSTKKKNTNEWCVIGHLFAASKHADYKGKPYPKIRRIIWDEYIREVNSVPGYLKNDIQALFSIYTSVARYRENVSMYLLGNTCNLIMPLFLFLNINEEPKSGVTQFRKRVNVDGEEKIVRFLIDYVKDGELIEQVKNSTFGALVAGSDEESVIINAEFNNGGNLFIEKKPSGAKFRYGFRWKGQPYGVWCDLSEGRWYINKKIPSDGLTFALTAKDMRPNLMLIEQATPFLKNLRRLYGYGMVYFDSPNTREGFVDLIRLIGLR